MFMRTLTQAQLKQEASQENKAIVTFVLVFTVLSLFVGFIQSQPTQPIHSGQLASGVSEKIR